MIDDNAEFLHYERSGGLASLYRVRHTLDIHREQPSLVMRLAVFIGQDSTRRWFPMLRGCLSNEHEPSNDLLTRHSWTAIEAVNVPASAMVETMVPKGSHTARGSHAESK